MKTDDLIQALTHETEPVQRPQRMRSLAMALGVGALVSLGLIVTAGAVRPDIGAELLPVFAKAGFSAAFAAAALPALLRLARPGRGVGRALYAIGALVLVCAIATGIALIGADPAERWRMWMGEGMPWCIVAVPLLAIPAAAGLFVFVRGLAPTALTGTGALIGAVSGGIGAMAYALYCPVDSVAFVATWYAAAIALCAVIGAILGSRLLRW